MKVLNVLNPKYIGYTWLYPLKMKETWEFPWLDPVTLGLPAF